MWQRLKTLIGRMLFSPSANVGAFGERQAADYLARQGYKIVARNWRNPRDRRDEIDLVCEDRGVLVFVEVKTRAAGALVSGYHAVDTRKKKVVRRAATAYMRRLRSRPETFRFDIVEVEMTSATREKPIVRHFENVELFPKHFRP